MRELRLGLVLAALCLPLALGFVDGRGGDRSLAFDVSDAPKQIAGLATVGDSELDPLVMEIVAPGAYLMREYSGGSTNALVYVAFYTGFGSSSAHDPQVCYPAQGFDIGEVRKVAVDLRDGSRVWSKVFRARQGGFEEVVLHWFQPRDRWPADPLLEPWVRMLGALRGRKAYAFVRVSVQIGVGGAAKAEQEAIAIAAELAPWTRGVLSGARSVGKEAPQPSAEEGGQRHGEALPRAREPLEHAAAGVRSGSAREHVTAG
jgi:EpsI family protein